MGRHNLEYPKDALNKVKRHGERGVYALERIHALVNASPLIHLSMTVPDSPFPVTLPMIGQMGSFARPSASLGDPLDLYVHGYVSGRMFNTASSSSSSSSSGEGIPVCVSAAHVDGLVLSLSAFNSSYNYRSVVLFGHAALVTDPEEKLYALKLLTDGVVPGRWEGARLPPTQAELQSTSVLRVRVVSGSLKARDGETGDDKHDMEDERLRGEVWTGVVPVHQVFGEPVPSSYNRVKEPPAYITDYARETTKENGEYAVNAINAQKK
ncbi:FMN-binding split barrel [Cordyceps fumosorosea ARSEF 2679]|uniref:FMN-binding split barrel n=1 Tax=Cordyceps fumosorosea (strain ARSEF 2679) TaxID=1081104 RepID=A0A167WIV5_CORFA|nr:FMN-binding split barrel [Cordyceps fumosorosea ARSEF 2679]OAA63844.1 FMN-binding split barrel [Cordyceps fumosorosea ARSEF 2679]